MHYSGYPLLERDGAKPIGVIHVKNIPFSEPAAEITRERLKKLARPCLEMREDFRSKMRSRASSAAPSK